MLADVIAFLLSLDLYAFLYMFWFFVIFDFTRYMLSLVGVVFSALVEKFTAPLEFNAPVSIILAGHNEAHALERCVRSLHEQTLKQLELIVVDDGSTDDTAKVGQNLQKQQLIDRFIRSDVRGGKSSAVNLGLNYCNHEIVCVVDIDTSFDRDAFEQLIKPFADPKVGAVSGNLGTRNSEFNMLTRFQCIEYLMNISLGRRFTAMLNILAIVSGAFGAFRRSAVDSVGGWEVGPGEDADISDKLRRAGWNVAFAHNAWALTDVPTSLNAFIKQRLRWNRSVIRYRFRKFSNAYQPFSKNFRFRDVLASFNILFFQVIMAISFFYYLYWIFINFGQKGWLILLATVFLYSLEDFIAFIVACVLYPKMRPARLGMYLIGSGLFNTYILRTIRVFAYLDELIFRRSYKDPYVPSKVRLMTEQM
jgi:biofilm PGA synthesis N-glycosyltransferase PgaC